jgi:L-lactate dehydrogenase complex protein LldG
MIAQAGVVASMVPELPGNRDLSDAVPASLQDVDLAVLRASFAVAETGSVALLARDLGVNSIGYLAQRLLILLDPADIVENLHRAYERPEFNEGHYLVLQTGPSATADIEGVLIHGAQGARALSVVLLR